MKNLLTLPRSFAVPVLLGCVAPALAQFLGTPAAEVWLGRPLDMTVPARLPAERGGDACVHADVFFGENRVRADRVRTTVLGTDQQRRVRIETSALVDEPVVTVSLRAGCEGPITRNYTLLPGIPSEAMLAGLARQHVASLSGAAPAAPPLGPRVAAAATSPRIVQPRTSGTAGLRAAAALRPAAAKSGEGDAARTSTARAFRRDTPRGARLRLEPIEVESQALLRVTANLAQPAGDAASRATAALLWQAINADPQELLRTTAMLQKLEGDLLQLRQVTAQTRSEMAALRQRLDQPQPWYLSAGVAQVLALLVLLAGTAAGVLWYRSRRALAFGEPWYAPPEAAHDSGLDLPAAQGEARLPEPSPAAAAADPPAAVATPPVARAPRRMQAPARAPAAPRSIDFEVPAAPDTSAGRRADGALRVETLAATFEEVEFLSSLGLVADAMDVLKAYVQDSTGPAPLAFFELMRLCDPAQDATAVSAVRRRYVQTFGIEPPRLEQVTGGPGLEGLAELSARITRAWGTPRALEIIEDVLFALPAPGAPLTLQAGRDLICLHGLAASLAGEDNCASEAEAHVLAPWANAGTADAAFAAAQAVADADGGRHFALDIDLDAGTAAASEPEPTEMSLAPLLAEMQAAAREASAREAARRQLEEEDAFSAAMASERVPMSRF